MNVPTVSICIPAYARPDTLRIAIHSVLSQEFADVEVVVGDDSGNLEASVAAIGDPRVRYHRNPTRLGMAGNWNAVLDRARGRYLGLLMDDDRLLPGFLGRTVGLFETDPSLGVIFTNHLLDEDGELRIRRCRLAGGRYERFLGHYLEHMPVAVSAALMRRDVWTRVRPLPDLKTADVVLHVRAALAGCAFHYVDEPLMAYRTHPGQLSSDQHFRDDVVAAWEQFEFDDPECERLRRGRLARALTSRAAGRLKHGDAEQARADIARARLLERRAIRLRDRAIGYLATHPSLVPAAMSAIARAKAASRGG